MGKVIDSSVFVEAVAGEVHKTLCLECLRKAYLDVSEELIEPSILLFEFWNVITRTQGTPKERHERQKIALEIIDSFLHKRPNAHFVDLNPELWTLLQSQKSSPSHKTQDDIFLSIAALNNSQLISIDSQMFKQPNCTAGKVGVISPFDYLQTTKSPAK